MHGFESIEESDGPVSTFIEGLREVRKVFSTAWCCAKLVLLVAVIVMFGSLFG